MNGTATEPCEVTTPDQPAERVPRPARYGIALLVLLPLSLQALANILGCDASPCEEAASSEGAL